MALEIFDNFWFNFLQFLFFSILTYPIAKTHVKNQTRSTIPSVSRQDLQAF
jgi:hypothetical protein